MKLAPSSQPQKLSILLEKTRIQAVYYQGDNPPQVIDELSETWTPQTLPEIFSHLSQVTGQVEAHIIIGGGLFQLTTLSVPAAQDSAQHLESVAQELLPTPIADLGIDYNLIDQSDSTHLYQLFIVKKSLLSLIGKAAQASNLHIESVKPITQTFLNALTTSAKSGTLLLWSDTLDNLALVKDNQVYSVVRFPHPQVYKQITTLLSSSYSDFGFKIKKILMPKDFDLDTKKLKSEKVAVQTADLDPFAENQTLSFDSDPVTPTPQEVFPDEDVQDQETPDENSTDESIMEPSIAPKPPLKVLAKEKNMENSSIDTAPKSNTKMIVVIVTIIVVLIGLVVGGLLVYRNAISGQSQNPQVIESDSTPIPQPTTTPSPEATQSATPTESSINKSTVNLQILNGSGIPGQAGKVADLLKKDDFKKIDTGNADSYDYTSTEVSVKATDTQLFDLIKSALSDSYTVTKGDPLKSTSEFDAVIIVGKE